MSTSQKKKHLKAVRPKLRAREPLLGVFMWGVNYSASVIYSVAVGWILRGRRRRGRICGSVFSPFDWSAN